jgi:4-amino-4-deoxy-L-arabinose transferase-like glycosyltransferase
MKLLPPVVLAIFTLLTRVLCYGPVYFADGPRHIRAILEKVYIIQPPGYWLFNRIVSLFPDPVVAISVLNILFSVAGVVVFYYTALFFAGRISAFIAGLAYSSVFYIWFSGDVHSTYASQILFPVALFCALLHYEQDKHDWKLWLAAVTYAFGAGLRPSDGAFLVPMIVYYSAVRLPPKKAIPFLLAIVVLCLAWVIPTGLAYRQSLGGMRGVISYVHEFTTKKSIMMGVNSNSIANVTRYALPLLVAFFPVLIAAGLNLTRNWKDWRVRILLLWIVPGSMFFTLSYIADAPYLNFLSAAILLLAVGSPRMLAVTSLWNTVLFLFVAPIPSHRLAVNVWNCYVAKYSRYGIQHQWWPNLSLLQEGIPQTSNQEGP